MEVKRGQIVGFPFENHIYEAIVTDVEVKRSKRGVYHRVFIVPLFAYEIVEAGVLVKMPKVPSSIPPELTPTVLTKMLDRRDYAAWLARRLRRRLLPRKKRA